jgi:hypothetical protein
VAKRCLTAGLQDFSRRPFDMDFKVRLINTGSIQAYHAENLKGRETISGEIPLIDKTCLDNIVDARAKLRARWSLPCVNQKI